MKRALSGLTFPTIALLTFSSGVAGYWALAFFGRLLCEVIR